MAIDLKEIISTYKIRDIKELTYCELKEFRKFALWDENEHLEREIFERMKELVELGHVKDAEFIGSAYF